MTIPDPTCVYPGAIAVILTNPTGVAVARGPRETAAVVLEGMVVEFPDGVVPLLFAGVVEFVAGVVELAGRAGVFVAAGAWAATEARSRETCC